MCVTEGEISKRTEIIIDWKIREAKNKNNRNKLDGSAKLRENWEMGERVT